MEKTCEGKEMIAELKGVQLVTENGLEFKADYEITYSVCHTFEEPSSTSMGCPDELEIYEIWLMNRRGKKTMVDNKKSFENLPSGNWDHIEKLLWAHYQQIK